MKTKENIKKKVKIPSSKQKKTEINAQKRQRKTKEPTKNGKNSQFEVINKVWLLKKEQKEAVIA